MSSFFSEMQDQHIDFITAQHIYFVATAPNEGNINLSPKGMDSLRIIDNKTVAWLNLTGSGNETAAHVLENGRMTMMFCSFDKKPLILRLYGQAKTYHPRDERWSQLYDLFPDYVGARQIFVLDIDRLQTSCGYAVPYYELVGERDMLVKSAEKKGQAGMEKYWADKNQKSIDGKDTGIL